MEPDVEDVPSYDVQAAYRVVQHDRKIDDRPHAAEELHDIIKGNMSDRRIFNNGRIIVKMKACGERIWIRYEDQNSDDPERVKIKAFAIVRFFQKSTNFSHGYEETSCFKFEKIYHGWIEM